MGCVWFHTQEKVFAFALILILMISTILTLQGSVNNGNSDIIYGVLFEIKLSENSSDSSEVRD